MLCQVSRDAWAVAHGLTGWEASCFCRLMILAYKQILLGSTCSPVLGNALTALNWGFCTAWDVLTATWNVVICVSVSVIRFGVKTWMWHTLVFFFPSSLLVANEYYIGKTAACIKSLLTTPLTQGSLTLLLSGLHGLRRAWPLGFPTMLLATGRRPPSMSKGGMWLECGSDRLDGRRESRTREHGQGKGGKKGSAERAAEFLLSKWCFCLVCYLIHKWEGPTVWKKLCVFALGVHIHTRRVFVNITGTAIYYSGHN